MGAVFGFMLLHLLHLRPCPGGHGGRHATHSLHRRHPGHTPPPIKRGRLGKEHNPAVPSQVRSGDPAVKP